MGLLGRWNRIPENSWYCSSKVREFLSPIYRLGTMSSASRLLTYPKNNYSLLYLNSTAHSGERRRRQWSRSNFTVCKLSSKKTSLSLHAPRMPIRSCSPRHSCRFNQNGGDSAFLHGLRIPTWFEKVCRHARSNRKRHWIDLSLECYGCYKLQTHKSLRLRHGRDGTPTYNSGGNRPKFTKGSVV